MINLTIQPFLPFIVVLSVYAILCLLAYHNVKAEAKKMANRFPSAGPGKYHKEVDRLLEPDEDMFAQRNICKN